MKTLLNFNRILKTRFQKNETVPSSSLDDDTDNKSDKLYDTVNFIVIGIAICSLILSIAGVVLLQSDFKK